MCKGIAYKVFVYLLLATFVVSCSERQTEWETLDAGLETLFTIGDDSSEFLGAPLNLVLDSDHNIIVADRARLELLVLNREGEFSHSIGQRGPGPEEFRDISGLHINGRDELFVFDRDSQSIKVFSVRGEYLASYSLPAIVTTHVKFESRDEGVLLFYINPNPGLDENNIMHLYSEGFEEIVMEGMPLQDVENFSELYLPLSIRSVGSLLVLENRILFAPAVYDGYLYEYELSEDDESVHFIQKYPGYTYKDPFHVLDRGDSSRYTDVSISGSSGSSQDVLIHNRSVGLFEWKDGKIIHFTYIADEGGGKRTFGFELYDHRMQPLGYAGLFDKPFVDDIDATNLLEWYSMQKGEDGRFYVLDREEDIPQLRVMEVDIRSFTQ